MPVYSRIRPRIGYLPTIVKEIIRNDPNDQLVKAISPKLGPLKQKLTDKWNAMPNSHKLRRWDMRIHDSLGGNLKEKLISLAGLNKKERERIIEERRKKIKEEYSRFMRLGFEKYVLSEDVLRDKALATEAFKFLVAKTGANGCRCEKPEATDPPPPPKKKHGICTQKLKCYNQCESGHDEVYLISVAVDGNGNSINKVSPKYSIDDDSDDVCYPHFWIYPTQDTNGFLDIAIQMMEDDGGYQDTANSISTIGSTVSAVGTAIGNPIVFGAGAALVIIGEITSIICDLDDDDDYGTLYRTWPSRAYLEAGVGAYIWNYSGEDWAGDNFDFDLTVQLFQAD